MKKTSTSIFNGANLLQGRRTVVTGACEGIGLQVAYTLAEQGAQVAIIHYDPDKAASSADYINENIGSDNAFPVLGDVSSYSGLDDTFSYIAERYNNTIDDFISNAARNYPCRIEDLHQYNGVEELDEMVSINQLGTIYCAAYSIPLLRNGNNPSFTMIGSCASKGSEGQGGYAGTKGALRAYLGTLVKEWAGSEKHPAVRVNLIEADYFEPTGMRSDQYLQALAESRRTTVENVSNDAVAREKVPVRREGRLVEIAEAQVYLILANYVNGNIITLSGGKTVRL